jgi:glutathione S-transferase
VITVYHLNVSQSERIIWLLEELGLPYELKTFQRDPVTRLAPPELREIHPIGSAPIIRDGDRVLAESGAIMEYIIARHGNGRLAVPADAPEFADYLYWFHYANGTLMPGFTGIQRALGDGDDPRLKIMRERFDRRLQLVEDRLGAVEYFSGPRFTAADIIMHFPLATMKAFAKLDLSQKPNIRAWLARVSARPTYQKAMKIAGHQQDPAL